MIIPFRTGLKTISIDDRYSGGRQIRREDADLTENSFSNQDSHPLKLCAAVAAIPEIKLVLPD